MRITKLKSLKVEGFRAFGRRAEFDLSADSIVVIGANGRGKTSLFDAILWGLTGQIPRLGEEEKGIVSLYSESGEARVVLELEHSEGGTVRLTRRFDGEEQRLRFEAGEEDLRDEAANVRLLEVLWPHALVTSDSRTALASALTRSVYLQQDRIRDFIESDTDQGRFEVVSELVGVGRVTELQAELDRAKRAWSAATNKRREELVQLRRRVSLLESQHDKLTLPSEADVETLDAWNDWWTRAHELGLQHGDVPADSAEAPAALDSAVKEIQVLRRARQRQVDLARELQRETKERAEQERPNLESIREGVFEASKATANARAQLAVAEREAAERRREQLIEREEHHELRALAELALRHLGDKCPVCQQSYDKEATRLRLVELRGKEVPEESDSGERVRDLAKRITDLEEAERVAVRALNEAEQAAQLHRVWLAERDRRVGELGVAAGEEQDIPRALENTSQQLQSSVQALEAVETSGERLGLALARSTEHARKVDLEGQLKKEQTELRDIEAYVESHDETGELAQRMLDALREATGQVVQARLERIEPLLQRIYATIDPHPTFRVVRFLTRVFRGRGQLRTAVQDLAMGVATETPEIILSSSQLNALAVSVFMALNLGVPSLPMHVAMLDDPVQSLDDVNLLGTIDLLRRTTEMRQLVISTHDERFGRLLARKLRPVREGQRSCVIEFTSWSRQGPTVIQEELAEDTEPMRVAV